MRGIPDTYWISVSSLLHAVNDTLLVDEIRMVEVDMKRSKCFEKLKLKALEI